MILGNWLICIQKKCPHSLSWPVMCDLPTGWLGSWWDGLTILTVSSQEEMLVWWEEHGASAQRPALRAKLVIWLLCDLDQNHLTSLGLDSLSCRMRDRLDCVSSVSEVALPPSCHGQSQTAGRPKITRAWPSVVFVLFVLLWFLHSCSWTGLP